MSKFSKIVCSLLTSLILISVISCAPARKSAYYQKRKKTSHVHTEQLGRNKYFFTPQYQKKLQGNYRKKK